MDVILAGANPAFDQASGGRREIVRMGTELLATAPESSPAEYENRIIFLTDAMPNTGDTSETSLLGMAETNAEAPQYTTFIGIGGDFNTTLIEAISKVRGANYYSVHSEEKCKERMDEEFEYMVTPLVFDLELKIESEGFEIEAVYCPGPPFLQRTFRPEPAEILPHSSPDAPSFIESFYRLFEPLMPGSACAITV